MASVTGRRVRIPLPTSPLPSVPDQHPSAGFPTPIAKQLHPATQLLRLLWPPETIPQLTEQKIAHARVQCRAHELEQHARPDKHKQQRPKSAAREFAAPPCPARAAWRTSNEAANSYTAS
eukprot:2360724-Rhodomonas_salina.1